MRFKPTAALLGKALSGELAESLVPSPDNPNHFFLTGTILLNFKGDDKGNLYVNVSLCMLDTDIALLVCPPILVQSTNIPDVTVHLQGLYANSRVTFDY